MGLKKDRGGGGGGDSIPNKIDLEKLDSAGLALLDTTKSDKDEAMRQGRDKKIQ